MAESRTSLAVSPLLVFSLLLGGVIALAAWRWNEERRLEERERDDSPQSASIARLRELELLAEGGAEALPEIASALDDADVRHQRAAMAVLGSLGSLAQPVASRLAACLDRAESDPMTCAQALEALHKIGAVPGPAVPRVAALRAHPDADLRAAATQLLDALDDAQVHAALEGASEPMQRRYLLLELAKRAPRGDELHLSNLHATLADSQTPDVARGECFALLVALGQLSLTELCRALQTETGNILDLALRHAEWLGPPAAVCAPAVGRHAAAGSLQALAALRAMGPAGSAALPHVEDFLRRIDAKGQAALGRYDHDRAQALRTLLALGMPHQRMVDLILDLADRSVLGTQSAALLAELDPQAAAALAARYVPLAHQPDARSRHDAAVLLKALRADDEPAVDALCTLAADESGESARSTAVSALALIGPRARRAVPLLYRLKSDVAAALASRQQQLNELASASPPAVIPNPQGAPRDTYQPSRDQIMQRERLEQLQERDAFLHATLLDALARIEGPGPELQDELRRALQQATNPYRRAALLYTWSVICDDQGEFLELARDILRDSFCLHPDFAADFSRVEHRLTQLPQALPLLRELLRDEHGNQTTHLAAVRVLMGMGPLAHSALPELRSLLEALPEQAVRRATEMPSQATTRQRGDVWREAAVARGPLAREIRRAISLIEESTR